MRHRATQLILPFEPALPGRQLILAPRLWPTMTSRARQQLAKRLAHLLRSVLIADGREMSGEPGDEHAAQSGKSGNDGASPNWPIFTCDSRLPVKSASIRR